MGTEQPSENKILDKTGNLRHQVGARKLERLPQQGPFQKVETRSWWGSCRDRIVHQNLYLSECRWKRWDHLIGLFPDSLTFGAPAFFLPYVSASFNRIYE